MMPAVEPPDGCLNQSWDDGSDDRCESHEHHLAKSRRNSFKIFKQLRDALRSGKRWVQSPSRRHHHHRHLVRERLRCAKMMENVTGAIQPWHQQGKKIQFRGIRTNPCHRNMRFHSSLQSLYFILDYANTQRTQTHLESHGVIPSPEATEWEKRTI